MTFSAEQAAEVMRSCDGLMARLAAEREARRRAEAERFAAIQRATMEAVERMRAERSGSAPV